MLKKFICATAFTCISFGCKPIVSYSRYVKPNSSNIGTVFYERSDKTVIDRGSFRGKIHHGGYRYYKESFGNVLYLYDGNTLIARIINPISVQEDCFGKEED